MVWWELATDRGDGPLTAGTARGYRVRAFPCQVIHETIDSKTQRLVLVLPHIHMFSLPPFHSSHIRDSIDDFLTCSWNPWISCAGRKAAQQKQEGVVWPNGQTTGLFKFHLTELPGSVLRSPRDTYPSANPDPFEPSCSMPSVT